jgi:hypothetical protein
MKNGRRPSRDKTMFNKAKEPKERSEVGSGNLQPDRLAVEKFQKKLLENKGVSRHDMLVILRGRPDLTTESGYTFNEDIRNKVQAMMGQMEKEKVKFEAADVSRLIKLIQTEKENEEMGDERADYSKDGVS